MLLTKEQVIASIGDLPDKFTLEDVMQRMYVLHKIEKARKKSKEGKTYSTAAAKKRLAKWLK